MVRPRLRVSRTRMCSPSRFTEHDVKRAMKGAKAAGFTRVRIHIDPLGNIVIDAGRFRRARVVASRNSGNGVARAWKHCSAASCAIA